MSGECYITTIKDLPTAKGIDRINYIINSGGYGFGKGARVLSNLKKNDKICFYLTSNQSVVLHAIVSGNQRQGNPPEHWDINDVDGLDYYNTVIKLDNIKEVKPPVKISEVRAKLGLPENWGNYVIQTHKIDETDFILLIGAE